MRMGAGGALLLKVGRRKMVWVLWWWGPVYPPTCWWVVMRMFPVHSASNGGHMAAHLRPVVGVAWDAHVVLFGRPLCVEWGCHILFCTVSLKKKNLP